MDAHTVTLGGYQHRIYASIPPESRQPPILALHGFGLDGLRSFRPIAAPLRERSIALHAIDLLGFGASAAPNRVYSLKLYASLVAEGAALLNASPILVGHSMGGKIAAAAAVLHPHRFAGLLLINPGGFSWMAPWLPMVASPRWANALLRTEWVQRRVLPHLPMGRFLAHPTTIKQALRLQDSHYALDLDATGLRPRLRTIHQPVGVLWGLDDPLLPPSTLDRLRADLPQARIDRLPQAGHLPMWDCPDAVADRITRFMNQTAPIKKRDDPTAIPLSAG
jgi:pimeloyl-ACP methyl ester carboxylesterase